MKKHIYWIVLLLSILAQSCSAPYHFDKFQKKGGKIESELIIDSIPYEVKIKGKDTTIFIPFEVECPEIKAPKTNSQIRQEEKTKRNESNNALKLELATMKHKLKIKEEQNDSLKIVNKTLIKEINANKQNKFSQGIYSLMWLFVVLIVFSVVLFIYQRFKK